MISTRRGHVCASLYCMSASLSDHEVWLCARAPSRGQNAATGCAWYSVVEPQRFGAPTFNASVGAAPMLACDSSAITRRGRSVLTGFAGARLESPLLEVQLKLERVARGTEARTSRRRCHRLQTHTRIVGESAFRRRPRRGKASERIPAKAMHGAPRCPESWGRLPPAPFRNVGATNRPSRRRLGAGLPAVRPAAGFVILPLFSCA